ncbi:PQQ-dependent sugar dehydrogenase [Puniceicoccaceae bacterium K14]|nr:PQQ-dependent sugar dehydrogenase [Puniceicoccaceae bacterium K14]
MRFNLLLISIVLLLTAACARQIETKIKAESPDTQNYTHEVIVTDLVSPWSIAFLPQGGMLITEKSGELILFKDDTKTNIQGVPDVHLNGQGGLMDIELHPNYAENGWIYISYSSRKGEGKGSNTAIIRAKLANDTLIEIEELYKGTPNTTRGVHYGSRITFDNQGYLFFSIGDRGSRDTNPQDITLDGGKIYRIHDDGRIPDDNPFIDQENGKKAIYSYGHRNPQGMTKHPETGEIWSHEHGPKGGDEINIIHKGKNYGWPVITYGINYSGTTITDKTNQVGMEQPLFYWVPSIAPSGMAFLDSDIYPDWQGSLLVGSLKFACIERITLIDNQVTAREKILENLGRVRSIKIGPEGYIYAGVEGLGVVMVLPKTTE